MPVQWEIHCCTLSSASLAPQKTSSIQTIHRQMDGNKQVHSSPVSQFLHLRESLNTLSSEDSQLLLSLHCVLEGLPQLAQRWMNDARRHVSRLLPMSGGAWTNGTRFSIKVIASQCTHSVGDVRKTEIYSGAGRKAQNSKTVATGWPSNWSAAVNRTELGRQRGGQEKKKVAKIFWPVDENRLNLLGSFVAGSGTEAEMILVKAVWDRQHLNKILRSLAAT